MSFQKFTYLGPYALCTQSKFPDKPDAWAHMEILDTLGNENLYYANGEGNFDSPACFAPNIKYEGQPQKRLIVNDADLPENGGFCVIEHYPEGRKLRSAFRKAFSSELNVLRSWFNQVEIVFGIIEGWN